MPDDVVLIPFGQTRAVPAGHQWCNACDGGGDGDDCEVCSGKGYWNRQDIDAYHKRQPTDKEPT